MAAAVPARALAVLERLHAAGHAAFIVGGSLRDALLGRTPADWDMATNATPDRLVALFPGAVYENRFGTIAVRREEDVFEITTFRTEHDYADFRRPHRVEFGDEIEADLARRDFTVNAMAWGRTAAATGSNALVDPFGGLADLEPGQLRAVGNPDARFREDALRMVRAVRVGGDPRETSRSSRPRWRHVPERRAWSVTFRASAWVPSWPSCSRHPVRRSGSGWPRRPGCWA